MVKRAVSLFIVVTIVISTVQVLAQDDWLIKNICFDSEITNDATKQIAVNGKGNLVTVVETSSKNKALKLDVKSGEAFVEMPIASVSNSLVFEAMVMTEDKNVEKKLFLQKDKAGKFNSIISLTSDGYFTLIDGRKVCSYELGKWYHIALEVNLKIKKYNLYINDKAYAISTPFDNQAIMDLAFVRFQVVSSSDSSNLFLDDIRAYKGDSVRSPSDFPKEEFNPNKKELKPFSVTTKENDKKVEVYIYDNFDKPEFKQWSLQEKGNSITIANVPDKSNKSVLIKREEQDPYIEMNGMVIDSTDIVFEFKVRTDDNNSTKSVYVKDAVNAFSTLFKINQSGNIVTADGVIISSVKKRKWYHIAIIADYSSKILNYYIDGKLVLAAHPLDNGDFTIPKVMRMSVLDGGESSIYFDDIKLYSGNKLRTDEELKAIVGTTADDGNSSVTKSVFPSYKPIIESFKGSIGIIAGKNIAFANGEKIVLKQSSFVENGNTFVPVRFVSEGFNGKVEWDETTSTITIDTDKHIQMTIGSAVVTVNGENKLLDAPPKIVDGVAFIPLRAFAEQAIDQKVFWDKRGLIVIGKAAEFSKVEIDNIYNLILYERPTAEKILGDLNKSHPRILANSDEFIRIKADILEEPMKSWYANVIKEADAILPSEVSQYVKPDGLRLLDTSRRVKSRTELLGMAYKISGDEKYAQRLWKELEEAGKFKDWNSAYHFLDTAEMTGAFALGYDWLYDYWSEAQKELIKNAIVTKGLMAGKSCYSGQGGVNSDWVKWNTNWNMVCNGGLAMGALAIADEEPELAGYILQNGLRSLEYVLGEFAPDGAWKEGPGYWDYAVTYLTLHIASLQSALGTDYGYFNTNNIDKTCDFPVFTSGPVADFNFNDAGEGAVYTPEMFYFAKRRKDSDLAKIRLNMMNEYRLRGTPKDLLWFDKNNVSPFVNLPLDKKFGFVEVASFRSNWNDKNALFGGIHGGENGVAHGDLDSGTFILDALGVRWASELGMDDYNLPGYFATDAQRWTYYRKRAEGQNTISISDGVNPDQQVYAFTTIDAFETKNKGGYAVVNMQDALAPYTRTAQRGMKLYDNRRKIVLQDELDVVKSSKMYWNMQTKATATIAKDGKSGILRLNGKALWVGLDTNVKGAKFKFGPSTPLKDSPNPDGQNKNQGINKLSISLAGAKGKSVVAVTFVPILDGSSTDIKVEKTIPISQWSIPDGEVNIPKLTDLHIDGSQIENFSSNNFSYDVKLPFGSDKPKKVTASAESNKVLIDETQFVPGVTTVRVVDINDETNVSTYSITYKLLPIMGRPEGASKLDVKKVTASETPEPQNIPVNVLDGDLNTRWSASGEQWILLDLGAVKDVSSVAMAFMSGEQRSSYYSIFTSEDNMDFKQVFKGESSGISNGYETVSIGNRKARYVKIFGSGNSVSAWNSYTEIEIYGK